MQIWVSSRNQQIANLPRSLWTPGVQILQSAPVVQFDSARWPRIGMQQFPFDSGDGRKSGSVGTAMAILK